MVKNTVQKKKIYKCEVIEEITYEVCVRDIGIAAMWEQHIGDIAYAIQRGEKPLIFLFYSTLGMENGKRMNWNFVRVPMTKELARKYFRVVGEADVKRDRAARDVDWFVNRDVVTRR